LAVSVQPGQQSATPAGQQPVPFRGGRAPAGQERSRGTGPVSRVFPAGPVRPSRPGPAGQQAGFGRPGPPPRKLPNARWNVPARPEQHEAVPAAPWRKRPPMAAVCWGRGRRFVGWRFGTTPRAHGTNRPVDGGRRRVAGPSAPAGSGPTLFLSKGPGGLSVPKPDVERSRGRKRPGRKSRGTTR